MVEISRTPAPPTAELGGVFRACQRDLLRTIVPLTGGDRAAAEDVVAEAFARAQRAWHRVGTYDRPDLWLRRVALNLAITDHRTRVRRRGRRLDPRPEATLDVVSVEVLDAVRALPERQAQVVVLGRWSGTGSSPGWWSSGTAGSAPRSWPRPTTRTRTCRPP